MFEFVAVDTFTTDQSTFRPRRFEQKGEMTNGNEGSAEKRNGVVEGKRGRLQPTIADTPSGFLASPGTSEKKPVYEA